ncbi:MAG: hypothetical protein K1Y36_09025, partial [Blastocatellia bacterium]|nr:hypothetical protein [Blastocatellia bacterium]
MRLSLFVLSLLCVCGWFSDGSVPAQTPVEPEQTFRDLVPKGNHLTTFSFLKAYPGAEYSAVYFGRRVPVEALAELETSGALLRNPRLWLVKGDLTALLGNAQGALACYRK